MKPFLSVIICTHNPREVFLARTLEGLRRQSLPVSEWELLLIDNASVSPVMDDLAIWHPSGRVVREDRLGLTCARLRGIAESRGELLLFVDDDNILRADYLEHVVTIHRRLPMLGCFGAAVIVPEYEEEPAADLRPYMSMLALRDSSVSRWSNDPDDPFTPWGAGMVVTRQVAETTAAVVRIDPLKESLGRRGTTLTSCEDDEFSWCACECGGGRGIFTELQLTHLIPRERLEKSYLLRLAEGHAYSRTILWHLHGRARDVVRPLASPGRLFRLAVARDGRRLGSEILQYGRVLSQTSLQRQFRRAQRRGMDRARELIADASVTGDHQAVAS